MDTLFCFRFILLEMAEEVWLRSSLTPAAACAKSDLQDVTLLDGTCNAQHARDSALSQCPFRRIKMSADSSWLSGGSRGRSLHRRSLMRKNKRAHTFIFHLLSMNHQHDDPAPPFLFASQGQVFVQLLVFEFHCNCLHMDHYIQCRNGPAPVPPGDPREAASVAAWLELPPTKRQTMYAQLVRVADGAVPDCPLPEACPSWWSPGQSMWAPPDTLYQKGTPEVEPKPFPRCLTHA